MDNILKPQDESQEQLIAQFENSLLSLNRVHLNKIIKESGKSDSPLQFIEEIMIPALERIGIGWEQGRYALSQVYMSGRISEEIIDKTLPPHAAEKTKQPNIAICVLEDHHLLGKRIVYTMLRASGFELIDYGSIKVDELIERIKKDNIRIILISVLMLPSALLIKQVKEKLKRLNLNVKLIVGGAPFYFDRNLAQEVGADYVGHNAFDAVSIINKTMEDAV